MAQGYSSREVAGFLVCLLGLAILASGAVWNPWVPRLWQGALIVDKADVLLSYFVWSTGFGLLILWIGRAIPTAPAGLLGALPLVFTLALIVLGDRFLLVEFGLPLWQYDAELHYRHRPNTVRSLRSAGRPGDTIRINRYGHHDVDFPVEKPEGEFRAVMLGDSVTMGHYVTQEETFSHKLEALLAREDAQYRSHQVINTAVHGYSTQQELRVLEESLRFEPDFIAVGFCLNDVTEPFLIDERLGGVGLDYHGVAQTGNRLHGYLMNETGIGRMLQRFQNRSKQLEVEKRRESFNVLNMSLGGVDDPAFAGGWKHVLSGLEAIYALAAEREIPVVLMVFPFDFQLLREDTRNPNRILAHHAREHGVPVLDFVAPFARVVYDDPELIEILRSRGYDDEQIQQFFAPNLRRVLVDPDHFTERGHEIVAQALFDLLVERGIAGPQNES